MAVSRSEKEEQFREYILRTAQQLFQQHGRQKVTMEDVAKAVGKAKSSLYYYYKSKDDIWDAVIDVETSEILAAVAQAVAKANTTEQKIRAFCLTKIRVLREKRALYHLAQGHTAGGEQQVPAKRSNPARRARYIKKEGLLLEDILNDGIEKGELRPLSKQEQDVLVFVLISGLHGLEKEIIFENDYSLEQAVEALSHMILYGLKK